MLVHKKHFMAIRWECLILLGCIECMECWILLASVCHVAVAHAVYVVRRVRDVIQCRLCQMPLASCWFKTPYLLYFLSLDQILLCLVLSSFCHMKHMQEFSPVQNSMFCLLYLYLLSVIVYNLCRTFSICILLCFCRILVIFMFLFQCKHNCHVYFSLD